MARGAHALEHAVGRQRITGASAHRRSAVVREQRLLHGDALTLAKRFEPLGYCDSPGLWRWRARVGRRALRWRRLVRRVLLTVQTLKELGEQRMWIGRRRGDRRWRRRRWDRLGRGKFGRRLLGNDGLRLGGRRSLGR